MGHSLSHMSRSSVPATAGLSFPCSFAQRVREQTYSLDLLILHELDCGLEGSEGLKSPWLSLEEAVNITLVNILNI